MTRLAENPYLKFGLDSDVVAWCALGAALLALALGSWKPCVAFLRGVAARTLLISLAASAALLSAGYVAYYLRGGPRIVDATHYYLQGRALAHGDFAFHVPEPVASFSGRFLVSAPGGQALGVLFPAGYPAALALAFRAGAPLALGPLLAAALVFATYYLARRAGANEVAARSAAGLSLVSAALRYHTADTMSHGLAALLLASALAAALGESKLSALGAGALLGWLCATRPVSAFAPLLGLAWALRRSPTRLACLGMGLLPGLALLLLQQRALTGDFFGSTQLAYYQRADGPPGCFRYGFGAGIGCLFEHGDYVRARLPHGYGIGAALATTWRRLLVHSLDIANFAPLALAVPFAIWHDRARRETRLLALVVGGGMLAYAPFYFEGSFPGGGARFFADLLPLEHVLLAQGLVQLRLLRFAWPLSLAGFALHTSAQHRSLRDREGGRPMYEASELHQRGIERGLVFVNTDHGFALGFDPSVHAARDGVVVARHRHDSLDRLLWESLGRPPSYCYDYDPSAAGKATLQPCTPEPSPVSRIEAESLWPPEAVQHGWIHPDFAPEPCVSHGRGLRLIGDADVRLPLAPIGQPTYVRLGWRSETAPIAIIASSDALLEHGATLSWSRRGDRCWESSWVGPLPEQKHPAIVLRAQSGLLDYLELSPHTGGSR
ncbi:MAG: hypothetical protein QM756_29585 [Polyangiaceae bacterium]